METFKLYKKFSHRSLPQGGVEDPMAAAELAEKSGDLSFLSEPLADECSVPASLLDRAVALGPKTIQRASPWKQIVAAVLTFAAFGSGSYALANGLSTGSAVTDPFSTNTAGLFEAASSTGFFTYE